MFISTAAFPVSFLYRGENDGEIIKILKNKYMNGLEINLECVIISFNHRFSAFNICCSPRSILMPSASRRALISTSGHNKH